MWKERISYHYPLVLLIVLLLNKPQLEEELLPNLNSISANNIISITNYSSNHEVFPLCHLLLKIFSLLYAFRYWHKNI